MIRPVQSRFATLVRSELGVLPGDVVHRDSADGYANGLRLPDRAGCSPRIEVPDLWVMGAIPA
jgi:hypothetical protein